MKFIFYIGSAVFLEKSDALTKFFHAVVVLTLFFCIGGKKENDCQVLKANQVKLKSGKRGSLLQTGHKYKIGDCWLRYHKELPSVGAQSCL